MTPCSISLALRKLIALTSIPMDGARIGSQRIGQFRLRGRDPEGLTIPPTLLAANREQSKSSPRLLSVAKPITFAKA